MMGLTERQSDCLRFVRARRAAGMPAPSYSEISRHLGVTRSNVHRLVHALIERGYLRFLPNRARTLALVEECGMVDQPAAAMLKRLYRAYVNTLETGRDRIVMLGGTCDPVDVMERSDPALIAVRAFLGDIPEPQG